MHNLSLAADYVLRARARLKAVALLLSENSYADVVRESQEIVELCLKALLRLRGIDPPRTHDVSASILQHATLLGLDTVQASTVCTISRSLRRDRELAFYGSEDLTPSEFYQESDAIEALTQAQTVFDIVAELVNKP